MQTFVRHPDADPVDDLASCAAAIRSAGWWTRSGLGGERWPLDTAEAAQMLAVAGEFDVDAVGLLDLVARRLLAPPGREEGDEFAWSAADVIGASGVLEARQQWRPSPSRHDARKHPCTVLLEQARAADDVAAIVTAPDVAGGPRFDARQLLVLLVAAESREGRAKIVALLRAVLEVEHGTVI
jgi:hypothetical protein